VALLFGDPVGDLCPRGEAELAQDVLGVALGGPLRDEQLARDLPVGQPLRDEFGDLLFAAGSWWYLANRGQERPCWPCCSPSASSTNADPARPCRYYFQSRHGIRTPNICTPGWLVGRQRDDLLGYPARRFESVVFDWQMG
jgi:hypothetical protein